jgi:hypothetical protein
MEDKIYKIIDYNLVGMPKVKREVVKQILDITDVVVPKGTICGYCNNTGWDSYPNHDTTPRPCPECQP